MYVLYSRIGWDLSTQVSPWFKLQAGWVMIGPPWSYLIVHRTAVLSRGAWACQCCLSEEHKYGVFRHVVSSLRIYT